MTPDTAYQVTKVTMLGIGYQEQVCCCSIHSQQHSCGSAQELEQMKCWLGDSLPVFTKRPALLEVAPCSHLQAT